MLYFLLLLIAATDAFDEDIHSKYLELSHFEFVEYFNSLNLSYRIGHDKSEHNHCTFIGHDSSYPKVYHNVSALDLPETFDARQKWPQCLSINKIYDQRHCGSCWMFGAATTATDRNCIHANINVDLSEQDLSCCAECYQGSLCQGGHPQKAFEFWMNQGLVSYACQPYDVDALVNKQYCSKQCVNGNDYNQDKNYGGNAYNVPADEQQIKAELFNNGPVEVSISMYEDFRHYTGGVYVHKYGDHLGYHSLRMIGYGQEGGDKYWLLANSWGTEIGENGFYKVKQFQSDLQLEDKIIAPMPKGR